MARQNTLEKELWAKHLHGQKKYGEFSFLRDKKLMEEEAKAELIDAINYMLLLEVSQKHSKKEIMKLGKEKWNKYFAERINEVKGYSNRSSNRIHKTIAKLRDLYKSL